jgi:D-serine deaminase-like pyridoxal phosphate-dependent protein
MKEWYTLDVVNTIDSPTLLFYKERIQNNIQAMCNIAGGSDRLRPHIKTHKCADIVSMMQAMGIKRYKCATIAEAEILGRSGVEDVLLAFQINGPKIDRLLLLMKTFPQTVFSSLVDNKQSAEAIQNAAAEKDMLARVYLDLDIGMHRTGITPDESAEKLVQQLESYSHVELLGLHAYDGHLHYTDRELRKREADKGYNQANGLKQRTEDSLGRSMNLVIGGTPTFPIHALREEVELSPGTCVLWDERYQQMLGELNFSFGALLLTRVVSVLSPKRMCLDLGHKSVAAEQPFPRVKLLNVPGAKEVAQSEEHLVIELEDTLGWSPGDVIYAVPYHICPTVALYEKAYVVEQRTITGEWSIAARDRKITI